MDARIKKLWVAALRSGEYSQGTGRLRKSAPGGEFEFCCLGVLCDLHAKETGRGKWMDGGGYQIKGDTFVANGLPPIEVYNWAGMGLTADQLFTIDARGSKRYELSDHNDSGATFEQIAKAIEEQA